MNTKDAAAALHMINAGVDALHAEIKELKRQLELTEKRALEWEQMHLDELEQRQRLQKELEGAHNAIRDQVERNMKKPEVVVADRMEKVSKELAREEWQNRRKVEEEETRKRDAHNEAVRKSVELQSQIMQENVVLYRLNTEMNKVHQDLVVRSVESNEKQTLLMENMSECLGNIVTALGVLSRRQ